MQHELFSNHLLAPHPSFRRCAIGGAHFFANRQLELGVLTSVQPPRKKRTSLRSALLSVFFSFACSYGIRAGATTYSSASAGFYPNTTKLVPGGIAAETRQVLKNLQSTLEAGRMNFTNVT
ncbi:2-iminobutanoate/2-iminopropanoate deaminase-like [Ixodes scapularis]